MTESLSGMRVVVGLSGGVDSAVAALLLKEQGCDVRGLFMKNWDEDDTAGHCSAADDLRDAETVCRLLDVPLRTVNFSFEYWENVFQQFLRECAAGRTPNPDVLCNREIKFKAFLDFARSQGADRIATGHYARVAYTPAGARLLRGTDPRKDQSYFLYQLGQAQLEHSLFPVGHLPKLQVRELAKRADLPIHAKKDSTGICFIGERRFKDFLESYLPVDPGPIETVDGKPLGEHDGLMYYTLGQRQGLGIGGQTHASGEPWYVVGKDVERKSLVVAQGSDHPALFSTAAAVAELHWVSGTVPLPRLECTAKVRYRQPDQACTLVDLDGNQCRVEFGEPQRAVTPGQSIVFYVGEQCLGGGVIDQIEGPAAAYQRPADRAFASNRVLAAREW